MCFSCFSSSQRKVADSFSKLPIGLGIIRLRKNNRPCNKCLIVCATVQTVNRRALRTEIRALYKKRRSGSHQNRIRIDFVKARGQTSRKLFLLSDKTVAGGTRLIGTRTHNWSNLTTRRHYPGEHRIELVVNGVKVAHTELTLYSFE